MTTKDTFMMVEATEKLMADINKQTGSDAFLDQTRHVCEHGGRLTDLGELILVERLHTDRAAA
jgi:hypothetical protein